MRYDQFDMWRPQRQSDLLEAMRTGMVVFDTNILLDLYKLRPDIRNACLEILGRLKARIFLPYQVLWEFWRNRAKLARDPQSGDRGPKYNVAIKDGLDAIEKTYRRWLFRRGETERADQDLDGVKSAVNALVKRINESLEQHGLDYDVEPDKDAVYIGLREILECPENTGHLDSDLRDQWAKQGAKRYEEKVPPGYEDAGKSEELKYGDYFIWEELLQHAQVLRETVGLAAVLMVTSDAKKDWTHRLPSQADGGEVVIPAPKLVVEARERAGVRYLQLQWLDFLPLASELTKVALPAGWEEAASAAADVTTPSGEYFLRGPNASASGSMLGAKQILVRQGAVVRVKHAPALTETYVNLREKMRREGLLTPHTADPENELVLTRDRVFSTPSAAASVILGKQSNGWTEWKDVDGVTLDEGHRQQEEKSHLVTDAQTPDSDE